MKKPCLPRSLRMPAMILGMSVIANATPSLIAAPQADGYQWSAMESGTTRSLHQISVVDNDFAVASGTHGTLLMYNGSTWSEMPGWSSSSYHAAMTDSWPLYVTALSKTNVWTGKYGSAYGTLVRWNGDAYTGSTVSAARTRAMASVDGLLIAARGENLVSISKNPAASTPTFTNTRLPFTVAGQMVLSVGGSSETNLWAITAKEAFRSTNGGAAWSNLGLPSGMQSGEDLRAMSVTTTETTWLGTSTGRLFSWKSDGSGESGTYSDALADLGFGIQDIYARDDEHIWIAGDNGNLWFFDGNNATQIDLGITQTLFSVTGNEHGVWAVGAGGVVFSTIPEPSTVSIALAGIVCFAGWRFLR